METSLFDSRDYWRAFPLEAFSAFVASKRFRELGRKNKMRTGHANTYSIRDSSRKQYTYLFSRFVRWMESHNLSIFEIEKKHIQSFLNLMEEGEGKSGRVLKSTIRLRYLRLFERVFMHLGVRPNPAAIAEFESMQSDDRGSDNHMQIMSEEEIDRFMNALPQLPWDDGLNLEKNWKVYRDRGMLALMLGAGVKPAELINMRIDAVGSVESTGDLPVTVTAKSTNGSVRHHRTQCRPFAAREVLTWVRIRRSLDIPGDVLFPGTKKGRPIDRTAVYGIVRDTFKRAGVEKKRVGPRTLRNSFATQELRKGGPVEMVEEFLGLRSRKSAELYTKGSDCR